MTLKQRLWYIVLGCMYIAGMIFIFWVCFLMPAHSRDVDPDIKEITPDAATVAWMESLKRPDMIPGSVGVVSCCGVGDAYPIVIDEEADSGRADEEGRATVTDPAGAWFNITEADGSVKQKFRAPITGNKTFKFPGTKVTKEIYGNPTRTAWAFLSVYQGEIHMIYCVVPLPPGV